jgi:hypothetical protein
MRVTSPPLNDKQKRYLRRSKGIKAPFSLDTAPPAFKNVRDYFAPVDANFIPCKPRGRSGCRMSHEKRLLLLTRALDRKAFFASLGVLV